MNRPYTITITKKKDGPAFKSPVWKKRQSLRLAPVTVITGNNGSGKTALLKAIAAGAGVNEGETTLSESKKDVMVYKGRFELGMALNSFHPHEVFLHSPVDQIAGRGYVETSLDIRRLFARNRSHGEQLQGLLLQQIQTSIEFLRKHESAKRRLLFLMDEPECAASLETMLSMHAFLEQSTLNLMALARAGKRPRVALFVATQSPALVRILVNAGAQRLDLGGWKSGDPFVRADAGYYTQCFIVAARRRDAGTPKLTKAMYDRIFHTREDAEVFAKNLGLELKCPMGIFEVEARVLPEKPKEKKRSKGK